MMQWSDHLSKKWQEAGFDQETPVQAQALPLIDQGKDLVALAPTGSGKTLAYLLPLLNRPFEPGQLTSLILVPSQELGQQIGQVIRDWKPQEMKVQVLTGGANLKRQIEGLKQKPEIVVGTLGRLLELSNQKKLKLHQIQTLVVDEADVLTSPDHLANLRELVKKLPSQRQLLFFSATNSDTLNNLSQWFNSQPEMLDLAQVALPSQIRHGYILTDDRKKDETLRRLGNLQGFKALIFVNSMTQAGLVVEKMAYHGIPIALLTSDLHQTKRAAALKAFKEDKIPFLITTDLAARGLDIPDLPCVIHYDLPRQAQTYTHRSGRTGRMGKEGMVLSLINPSQVKELGKLLTNKKSLQAYEVYGGQLVPIEEKGLETRSQASINRDKPKKARSNGKNKSQGEYKTSKAPAGPGKTSSGPRSLKDKSDKGKAPLETQKGRKQGTRFNGPRKSQLAKKTK